MSAAKHCDFSDLHLAMLSKRYSIDINMNPWIKKTEKSHVLQGIFSGPLD